MLVERIFALYEEDERRKPSTGYPTGSRLGTCTAQLQMLRFPRLTNPSAPQPRDIMRWDEGGRTEEWLAELLQRALPNVTGLRQEPFYFRVPLPEPGMVEALRAQIARRKGSEEGPNLWGVESADRPFVPPSIRFNAEGRPVLRLLPCGPRCEVRGATTVHAWGCKKKQGFVLDPHCAAGPSVWVPTYIDFAIPHPVAGSAILEAKSMSNWAFRRALLGELDYGKRMQLVGFVEATGLPVVLAAYRKETSHWAEIVYTPTAANVRVVITKMNGQQEAFLADKGQLRAEATGDPAELPADTEWSRADVFTPYEPALVAQIHEHVRRVLLASPGAWHRQYGPDFTCQRCGGTGTQTMTKGGATLLKKPKPCEDCGATGMLDEVDAPGFPCGYCSVVQACLGPAKVRLEIDTKPHYRVRRADWEASGLQFTPPDDGVAPLPPVEESAA